MRSLISVPEEEVMTLFESVTGDNYQNDNILYDTLTQEIIPKYRRYSGFISLIAYPADTIKTEKVESLHDTYNIAVLDKLNFFLLLRDSIKEQDEEVKKQAYEILKKSEELMEKHDELFKNLNDKYGLPELDHIIYLNSELSSSYSQNY
ncbi:hypothetical protein ERL59_02400 [Chengkuizengella sp. YPA3-1-1]|uniref:Uncharacterized protein n=2 Tax=Chengkuizengella marina TaxID=2507566 RepID=A0A6N9PYC2_9BACL|nr:hypothetical protein [Chengkuizengella marina]